jgi:pyrroloquinoline quinone biosynthesis protein D
LIWYFRDCDEFTEGALCIAGYAPVRLCAATIQAAYTMKIIKNAEVLWREEDEARAQAYEGLSRGEDVSEVGTSILFSDGVMLSLNLLGTEIWKICDGKSIDSIVSELLPRFDADPEVLKKDTIRFIADLAQKGFVRYEE